MYSVLRMFYEQLMIKQWFLLTVVIVIARKIDLLRSNAKGLLSILGFKTHLSEGPPPVEIFDSL